MTADFIQSFQVEGSGLRGRIVRLGSALDEILHQHDYPPAVSRMLAEAITLAALLASMLKFDGVFTLQTKSDGPISMLIADYRSPGAIRGYAAYDRAALERLDVMPGPHNPVPRLMGNGYLAFTVDQGEHMERYQGIVELAGATLADCAQSYFRQSEQIAAAFRLAIASGPAGRDASGSDAGWRSGGIMVQRLAQEGGINGTGPDSIDATPEDWLEAVSLLATTTDTELLDFSLGAEKLLWRLYHEPGVRAWPAAPVFHACTCSRERMQRILRSFSLAEIQDMVEDGAIKVACEFCNKQETFDPKELTE